MEQGAVQAAKTSIFVPIKMGGGNSDARSARGHHPKPGGVPSNLGTCGDLRLEKAGG